MGWPQWVFIALALLNLVAHFAHHGEPKTGITARYNAGYALFDAAVVFGLLYAGGFFG